MQLNVQNNILTYKFNLQGTSQLKSKNKSTTDLLRGQNARSNVHLSCWEVEMDHVRCGNVFRGFEALRKV